MPKYDRPVCSLLSADSWCKVSGRSEQRVSHDLDWLFGGSYLQLHRTPPANTGARSDDEQVRDRKLAGRHEQRQLGRDQLCFRHTQNPELEALGSLTTVLHFEAQLIDDVLS